MSLFSEVQLAAPDPILGVTDAFRADPRPFKVNLGVGIYQNEDGKLPLLDSVREAEQRIAAHPAPRPYLSIDGNEDYDDATAALVLGGQSLDVAVTVQTLGGSGALKVGGDFLHGLGVRQLLVSDPTWDNHLPILGGAGLQIGVYRYYDPQRGGLDFEGMLADLRAAKADTVVLLHACCHNPTGYDLTQDQWQDVLDVVADRGLVPFIDMAYQGFADGFDEDAFAIREIARRGMSGLCANSYSKTFGLYGERVGGLTLLTQSPAEASRVRSQVKLKVRANYSNPPTHGEAIVATILADPQLRAAWMVEVDGMRARIKAMRAALVQALAAEGVDDAGFIEQQRGMFSYMGLSRDQMVRLREDFAVFGVESGRLCVAALNHGNVGRVAAAIAAVSRPVGQL